jgi:hypothetical protein
VGAWQHQRYLRHTSRAGRPTYGRSTSSTAGRSFTHAAAPHSPRRGRSTCCSTLDMHADRLLGLVVVYVGPAPAGRGAGMRTGRFYVFPHDDAPGQVADRDRSVVAEIRG